MIFIKGDSFLMGTNNVDGFPADGEGPVKEVIVNDFYMDASTVRNRNF